MKVGIWVAQEDVGVGKDWHGGCAGSGEGGSSVTTWDYEGRELGAIRRARGQLVAGHTFWSGAGQSKCPQPIPGLVKVLLLSLKGGFKAGLVCISHGLLIFSVFQSSSLNKLAWCLNWEKNALSRQLHSYSFSFQQGPCSFLCGSAGMRASGHWGPENESPWGPRGCFDQRQAVCPPASLSAFMLGCRTSEGHRCFWHLLSTGRCSGWKRHCGSWVELPAFQHPPPLPSVTVSP